LLLQGWTHPENDQAKDWRESSEDGSVFFKYGVVITPLLILWYYLAVQFENVVPSNQILFMCIFVLLPSVLIFLSVGSWLPMAGSIICVIAINHSPPSFQSIHWNVHMRHLLLFLTAICNSIQFAWIMDLISEVCIYVFFIACDYFFRGLSFFVQMYFCLGWMVCIFI